MTGNLNQPKLQFALLSALAATTGVAIAIDGTVLRGALSGAALLTLAAFLYFGRDRFDVVNVLSGAGDERTRSLYTSAVAFAGNVLIAVVTVWWLVGAATGDVNETLTVLGGVGAAAFLAAAVVASRRG